jgi:hypothetical protein
MNFMNELVEREELKCLVRTVTNRIRRNDKFTAVEGFGRIGSFDRWHKRNSKGGECVFAFLFIGLRVKRGFNHG